MIEHLKNKGVTGWVIILDGYSASWAGPYSTREAALRGTQRRDEWGSLMRGRVVKVA